MGHKDSGRPKTVGGKVKEQEKKDSGRQESRCVWKREKEWQNEKKDSGRQEWQLEWMGGEIE